MKIIVGLSGGVDSSVAAFLLKNQGYNITCIFLENYVYNNCSILEEDKNEAMIVSKQLNIPFKSIDISHEYEKYIIDYTFSQYKKGYTPNPDIICNKKIKFNIFLNIAIKLGAEKIATGHYAIIKNNIKNIYNLHRALDKEKDQSYFLCQLNQYQLSKIILPLGIYKKKEVRLIAKKLKLITAKKKDSYGICFLKNVKLSVLLNNKFKTQKGDIIKIPKNSNLYNENLKNYISIQEKLNCVSQKINYNKNDGIFIGQHEGVYSFTKGQRKGIKIGGTKYPLFVIKNDVKKNILFVGENKNHPGLYKKAILIYKNDIHWINDIYKKYKVINIYYNIRYRQSLKKGKLYQFKKKCYIEFKNKEFAVSEGQFIVIYIKNEIIASAIIK